MKIKREELKKVVVDTILQVTEDIMNGEEAINLEITEEKNGDIEVSFDMDCGRSGIDSYGDSYILFKKNDLTVYMRLGEMLEGGGIEDEVEEALKDYVIELFERGLESNEKSVSISYDTSPEDMLDILENIFKDFGIEYKKDESETISYSYKIP